MDKRSAIDELYEQYAGQAVLAPLRDGKRTVKGHGPLDAPLVVVGEAPGAEEDRQGRPFVGPSGRLLRELFARAGMPWEACYVMNTVPWRPPGNRTPYPFEITASYRRVEQEIGVIAPQVVVAAGATAWKAVTGNERGPFTESLGQVFQGAWKDWAVMPVRHPSAILRSSGRERELMEEQAVQFLSSLMGAPSA